jgi:hypothetical protein
MLLNLIKISLITIPFIEHPCHLIQILIIILQISWTIQWGKRNHFLSIPRYLTFNFVLFVNNPFESFNKDFNIILFN